MGLVDNARVYLADEVTEAVALVAAAATGLTQSAVVADDVEPVRAAVRRPADELAEAKGWNHVLSR